jgi:hypothetical protein
MDSNDNGIPEKESEYRREGPSPEEEGGQIEEVGDTPSYEETPEPVPQVEEPRIEPFLFLGGRQLRIIITTATKEGEYQGKPVPMETITVAFENEGGKFARGEITDFLEIAYIARYIALVELMWFGDKAGQLPPSLLTEKLRKQMASFLRARLHLEARTALTELDNSLRKTGRVPGR